MGTECALRWALTDVEIGCTRPWWLCCGLLWLVLLLAVVNLWRKRRESRGRLLLLTIPLVALQMVSTPLVAHLALGTLEWQYPPLESRPEDCQAIVVLAGAILAPDKMRDRTVG